LKRAWILLLSAVFAIGANGKSTHSRARLAPPGERGTPLIVSGRVFDATGTRGVPGVKLYAYHTDATGVYGAKGNQDPRLKGTVVTDAEGRFEWETIRPMPYPGGGNPAHIHIQASGGGFPQQWVDEMQFSDDPYLTPAQKTAAQRKGGFTPIVTPTRDGKGVLHATLNIRLSNNPTR
jgi:protocatechuate 3,4-dioxygenase beta subunit